MPDIPDTLLLEERAALAMNAVAGLRDPDSAYPFFSANLAARPARLQHGDWDYGSSHGRLTDASVLARHMTGSTEWLPVEQRYRTGLLDLLAPDGLTYRRAHPRGHWQPNANLIDQRATLLALTTSYLDEPDPAIAAAADRQVAALHRIAIKERDVWFYPASEYTRDGWPSANAIDLHLAPDPASFSGRLIMPLLRYHQATGNAHALELCGWFTKLIVEKSGVYHEDGSFNSARAYRSGHFHTRLGTLEGLARYAEFTGDHALSGFVVRSYDWALSHATRFGWTPGDLTEQRFEHETCSLVDLIGIGTVLARCGWRRYWGVVERFLRNHLTESQLLDLSWVESAPDGSGDEPGWISHRSVGERMRGAFAGYGAPNDYVSDVHLGRGHTNDIQACCVGSGIRGLFYGWNSTITGDEDLLRVNLLLTRAHALADVHSHLPHTGRVDVLVHRDCRELRVRVPDWAGYAQVRVIREGPGSVRATAGPADWAPDDHVSVAAPRAGERITVSFPLAETETRELAADQEFRARWRGDTVVGISPPGRYRPMYQRGDLTGTAPARSRPPHRPAEEWSW